MKRLNIHTCFSTDSIAPSLALNDNRGLLCIFGELIADEIDDGVNVKYSCTECKEIGLRLVKVFSCTTWEVCHDQALAVRAFYMKRSELINTGIMLASIKEVS